MNVAFVGLGQQLENTRSSRFFIDLLEREWGRVRVVTSEWNWVHLPRPSGWDLAVFWQHMPSRLLLDSVTFRNVVLVPMYDDCPKTKEFWDNYRDCGVVCFSRAMGDLLEGWGHRVHQIQYFPEVPAESVDWSRGPRCAFFWPRKRDVDWTVARLLLSGWSWEEVHLHVTEQEPLRTRNVTPEDRARFHIRQTRWFHHRAEFRRALARSQVFLAPRRAEGIGMSFLEAMALGMMVVAPDGPTMNEYIQSGVNGFLYDPDDPARPSWEEAENLGKAARESMIRGLERWRATVPGLLQFLRDPGLARRPGRMIPASQAAMRTVLAQYRKRQFSAPIRWVKRGIKSTLMRGG